MKLSQRFVRLAAALGIAGMVAIQVPLRGGSGIAMAQDEYPSLNGGGTFAAISQVGGYALVLYGVLSTTQSGVAQPILTGAVQGKPLEDIFSARADDFSEIDRLLDQGELQDTMRTEGPYTFFAPTNAALAQVPADTVASLVAIANRALLQSTLKLHVVPGRYLIADLKAMPDNTPLQTLTGDTIMVTNTGGLKVNGVAVVEEDIPTIQGWVHPLQGLLSPPN
ncbi:MAG: fasciclin domain-containing protein [Armatimonadota bacterium]